jgi:hypothetical protein
MIKHPSLRQTTNFHQYNKTDASILYDSSCTETVTACGHNEQNNGTPYFWAEIVTAHGYNKQNNRTPDF